ncbi:uncharacterized protein MELLADRAFT_113187 [Melampsora larici-populina 98AG31]|uniref:Uncharacterized protein n=1 Tax=Melampsora larici-populina (strain 98AG31 / pathotype 3-4-7) TaxID=747676 RepID=F4S920_MELLP|nr:uncharacterized protein MELLADRAFT_113187 [Melampsora larici-populina 98AG31]EGF98863.1 hypothetical protein MELLADRAFT_113187 [Melampsora larici-populina 98AG31]
MAGPELNLMFTCDIGAEFRSAKRYRASARPQLLTDKIHGLATRDITNSGATILYECDTRMQAKSEAVFCNTLGKLSVCDKVVTQLSEDARGQIPWMSKFDG